MDWIPCQINCRSTRPRWKSSARHLHVHQLLTQRIQVGSDLVTPVSVVHDLGIHVNNEMSMWSNVRKTMSACFAIPCQLRSICWSVPRTVLQALMPCFVLLHVYYSCFGWHSASSCTAPTVSYACGGTSRLWFIEVRHTSLHSYVNCSRWNFYDRSISSCQYSSTCVSISWFHPTL